MSINHNGNNDSSLAVSSRKRVSDPSLSVLNINIPEVINIKSEFLYKFHVPDELIRGFPNNARPKPQSVPRYAELNWIIPVLSDFEINKINNQNISGERIKIEKAFKDGKIISEDNFFNPGYITHTFSNSDVIEQGSSDLENFSRLKRYDTESVSQMSSEFLKDLSFNNRKKNKYYDDSTINKENKEKSQFLDLLDSPTLVGDLFQSYQTLADFPKNSLGLRVYDSSSGHKKIVDKDDLIRSISDSISLDVKINSLVIPDLFEKEKSKLENATYNSLSVKHSESINSPEYIKSNTSIKINPVKTSAVNNNFAGYTSQPVKLIGYIIDRYQSTTKGFIKEETFFIEDINVSKFQDSNIIYGKTYVYTVRIIGEVSILSYDDTGSKVEYSTLYVSSRTVSTAIEAYEYVPPPPPDVIEFIFDYQNRNLILTWQTPVNPQRDIKQYQIFRRKTIREPFELIAQIGFDDTIPSNDGLYKTGEKVDANNLQSMDPTLKVLVSTHAYPVSVYRDIDFTVDIEQLVSSEYIYSICSVDAHGMISNYSSQYHVTFDQYKNKLDTKLICDSGSPKQYPNMNLREDAFKDILRVEGDVGRNLKIFCTPEYLAVKNSSDKKFTILETQTPDLQDSRKPYYLIQLINLDNQKMQMLKINVKDSKSITKFSRHWAPKPAVNIVPGTVSGVKFNLSE